jgi:hypothetical protein
MWLHAFSKSPSSNHPPTHHTSILLTPKWACRYDKMRFRSTILALLRSLSCGVLWIIATNKGVSTRRRGGRRGCGMWGVVLAGQGAVKRIGVSWGDMGRVEEEYRWCVHWSIASWWTPSPIVIDVQILHNTDLHWITCTMFTTTTCPYWASR